jgi:hypothetical protein
MHFVASRYKATVRGILYVTAVGSLAWVAGLVLFGDVFLSPARLALFIALPVAVAAAAIVLLFLPPPVQLLGLICGVAAVVAVYGAEVYRDAQSRQNRWTGWTPWQVTEDLPYPHTCGKYVDAVDADGRIASVLTWQGSEVQPAGGISANHFGGGVYCDRYGFLNPPGQWRQDEVESSIRSARRWGRRSISAAGGTALFSSWPRWWSTGRSCGQNSWRGSSTRETTSSISSWSAVLRS